jgi:hypothetical protein
MAEEEAKSSAKNVVKRVKGVSIEKPFVIGSMAWLIPKKEESVRLHLPVKRIPSHTNTN